MQSPPSSPSRRDRLRRGRGLRFFGSLGLTALGLAAALSAPSCSSPEQTGTSGSGGSGAGSGEALAPGEVCSDADPSLFRVRAEPATVFLPACAEGAPCPAREVKVTVDPDVCSDMKVSFDSSDPALVAAPEAATIGLHRPTVSFTLRGGAKAGNATINVHVKTGATTEATAPIEVVVLDAKPAECPAGTAAGEQEIKGGVTLRGKGALAGATIGLPEGADKPNSGSYLWSVAPFTADVACGADATPAGYLALGPAITFGPETKTFKREVPLSIPINPALLPEKARLRHLRVAYSGPAFKAPRAITVADPRIEQIDGQWALTFKAPRLGTYQAVVKADAGSKKFTRRMTHRAVIGVSMGGAGTAMFGTRHHDRFDVIAPLGGPVDWTWLLHYIETNNLGGFRPIAKGTKLEDLQLTSTPCATSAECQSDETCMGALAGAPATPGRCVLMPNVPDPYTHPSTFNTWWYEYPRTGNGGDFSRQDYSQIFRDLGLMFGNPNGENLTPGAENLPAGVRPDDKSVLGDHPGDECKVWVDPLDGPDKDKQNEIAFNCPKERCAHTLTLSDYYDDEYNPDGAFPVITVCDGSPQNPALSPYSNTWTPQGNDYPLEVGLAVDYNGNGVRDELEPIIRAGHEPWQDVGLDGLASKDEPGYQPGVNEDPAGDDYDPQYNPTGTEGDHRYQQGEPFDDVGLDGVAGTKQQPAGGWQQPGDGYDVGEGDGKYTVARGLQRFWDVDAHSIVRQWVDPAKLPAGELNDAALSRLDVWTDGGTRDLFNFAADAQHLAGAFAARGRDTAYFTEFQSLPGADPKAPNSYTPARLAFGDLQGVVFQRYGVIDPTQKDVEDGRGQHVGSVPEFVNRLQTALYFVGSRWQDPELRKRVETSADDPDPEAPECEVLGSCTLEFTSKDGRKGPVEISFPPGYANKKLKDQRYPVIFFLHGYGQSPEDLKPAIALIGNWMNGPVDSSVTRLPKAILVYVDGRCRVGASGKAECIRGTFFGDSVRGDGAHIDTWWTELMDYVDQNYRTMGDSQVEWTE